jgi:FlaA1/EpsC-like NDP-sugar epimerase
MRKHLTRASQVGIDLGTLACAYALAFVARYEGIPPTEIVGRMLLTMPYVVGFTYLVLFAVGVPRFAWRFIGLREVTRILAAFAIAVLALVVCRIGLGELQDDHPYLRHGVVPFGVVVVYGLLGFLGIGGVRVLRRLVAESAPPRKSTEVKEPVRTLLVGAGQAGFLVARELASHRHLGIEPVGFVDDDKLKIGTTVHGIAVLGATTDLAELAARTGATQVLITIANAPGRDIRRIRNLCDEAGLPAKIIPGLYEIVGGSVNLSRIRDVAIEDLLGRAPVELDVDAIAHHVRGKAVLVTGAGGSIGSELCRQLCGFEPANLILLERAENALFNIHRELATAFPAQRLTPLIADVCDVPRLSWAFAEFHPAVVFHAAAHKHVPMMEWNPGEAVKNNVIGTQNVATLAHEHETETFVLISTDKAVNPSSVMGASKRVAEMVLQALSSRSRTRFVTVRFGNVLGSAGSVIPIFKEQIAAGGPVTVTHPDMRRYFMTIPEACQLVLQAASMGRGGEIFVLDMGEPVKIVDLARDLIALSGLREGEDIEIRYTGVRPGEKLFEELSTDEEQADKTRHPKVFVGRVPPQDPDRVAAKVARLREAATQSGSAEAVRAALMAAVPEYSPTSSPSADATAILYERSEGAQTAAMASATG